MNDLTIFSNPSFGEIRTVTINNEPWFVGKDITDKLGYQNGSRDITRHVDEDDQQVVPIPNDTQARNMLVINESGLYSMILGSKLASAKKFKRWVTSEVLPSIRKTGSYKINRENIPLKEQVESLEVVSSMLHMNDASKILMLQEFYQAYNIPTNFLPKYELNGNRQMKSLTALLTENNSTIKAVAFNKKLIELGYLEERERKSSKGGNKKFKALTEKGLKYGENAVSPHNQHEVQPLYYDDSFAELYQVITEM